ncbi:hypothetical protein DIE17_33185 [Burkholderia sp. Bp9099]|nr:hypothetical protein DIE17_33185 [Burkholderia sp. Bp9099]
MPVESVAKVAASPIVRGSSAALKYARPIFGEVDITAYTKRVIDQTEKVTAGDMSSLESTLTVQAGTLDAIFNRLAIQAAQTSYGPTQETLLRMALKAQAQCANTIKVLGELKNPRSVAFIRQQNNAAGHQQVNNCVAPPATSRVHGEKPSQSNELLEHQHGEWLDAGATGETSRGNQAVEAVEAIHGTADRRG